MLKGELAKELDEIVAEVIELAYGGDFDSRVFKIKMGNDLINPFVVSGIIHKLQKKFVEKDELFGRVIVEEENVKNFGYLMLEVRFAHLKAEIPLKDELKFGALMGYVKNNILKPCEDLGLEFVEIDLQALNVELDDELASNKEFGLEAIKFLMTWLQSLGYNPSLIDETDDSVWEDINSFKPHDLALLSRIDLPLVKTGEEVTQ